MCHDEHETRDVQLWLSGAGGAHPDAHWGLSQVCLLVCLLGTTIEASNATGSVRGANQRWQRLVHEEVFCLRLALARLELQADTTAASHNAHLLGISCFFPKLIPHRVISGSARLVHAPDLHMDRGTAASELPWCRVAEGQASSQTCHWGGIHRA